MLHSRDDPHADLPVRDVVSTANLLVRFHLNSVTKFLAKKKKKNCPASLSLVKIGTVEKIQVCLTEAINKILSRFVHFSFELLRILYRTCPEERLQYRFVTAGAVEDTPYLRTWTNSYGYFHASSQIRMTFGTTELHTALSVSCTLAPARPYFCCGRTWNLPLCGDTVWHSTGHRRPW